MPSSNSLSDNAFVLHSRPYRDSSMLVDMFTEHHGRFRVVAKGVRSKKSSKKGLLQPFQPLLIQWVGQRDLVTLREVEPTAAPFQLNDKYQLIVYYMNELLLRLLHPLEAVNVLFQQYHALLAALATVDFDLALLRYFERDLLKILGYGLQLKTVEHEQPIQPDAWYQYDLQQGPQYIERPTASSLQGESLLALANNRLETPLHLRDAKRLLQAALKTVLGDKPLKSREFLRKSRTPHKSLF